MNSLVLKDNDQVSASIVPADAKGFPVVGATFDAPPAWSASDTTILALAPSADGLSCVISSAGGPGTATLSVSASVGGAPVVGTAQIQIVPGDVASVAIAFGTPSALAAAAAPAAPSS